jgi:putative transposase
LLVNHKLVDRLYAEASVQVKRRKRKKIPVGEREKLFRPGQADQIWSMDFVFDRSAEGRVVKCLTIPRMKRQRLWLNVQLVVSY